MAAFQQDGFSGIAGALEAHTPDIGAGWALKVGTISATLNGAGLLTGGIGGSFTTYMATAAPGTTDYFAQIDDPPASGSYYPFCHMTSDCDSGYVMKYSTRYQLYKRVAGTDVFMGQSALMAAQTCVRYAIRSNGAGGNIHELYAGAAGSTLTLVFSYTEASSDLWGGTAPIVAAGNAGFRRFNGSAAHTADNFIAGPGTSPGLAAGAITLSTPAGPDATNIRLTAAAATGGVGPYTYQWYRSSTPGFTPGAGSILAGKTSLALVDTPPDGAIYYYRIRATDSAGTPATADSATFGASLFAVPLVLLFAGDSNYHAPPADGTENPPTLIIRHMQKVAGVRGVTGAEAAVSGASSASWLPGQTAYTTAVAAYAAAIAAAPAGAVVDLFYMIGSNDAGSVSAATFQANVLATVQGFKTALPTLNRVLLCYQLPIQAPADQTRNQALLLYQASLAAVAATDPTHVKVIGQDVYKFMWPHPEYFNYDPAATPGIHILKLGVESLAAIQARDYAAILNPAVGVSGGSFAWAA